MHDKDTYNMFVCVCVRVKKMGLYCRKDKRGHLMLLHLWVEAECFATWLKVHIILVGVIPTAIPFTTRRKLYIAEQGIQELMARLWVAEHFRWDSSKLLVSLQQSLQNEKS